MKFLLLHHFIFAVLFLVQQNLFAAHSKMSEKHDSYASFQRAMHDLKKDSSTQSMSPKEIRKKAINSLLRAAQLKNKDALQYFEDYNHSVITLVKSIGRSDAEKLLSELIEEDNGFAAILILRLNADGFLKDNQNSSVLKNLLVSNKNPYTLVPLARAAGALGNVNQAISYFDEAYQSGFTNVASQKARFLIELKTPEYIKAGFSILRREAKIGNLSAARALHDQLYLHPEYAENDKEAISWLEYCYKRGDVKAHIKYSTFFKNQKDYKKAQEILEEALKLDPNPLDITTIELQLKFLAQPQFCEELELVKQACAIPELRRAFADCKISPKDRIQQLEKSYEEKLRKFQENLRLAYEKAAQEAKAQKKALRDKEALQKALLSAEDFYSCEDSFSSNEADDEADLDSESLSSQDFYSCEDSASLSECHDTQGLASKSLSKTDAQSPSIALMAPRATTPVTTQAPAISTTTSTTSYTRTTTTTSTTNTATKTRVFAKKNRPPVKAQISEFHLLLAKKLDKVRNTVEDILAGRPINGKGAREVLNKLKIEKPLNTKGSHQQVALPLEKNTKKTLVKPHKKTSPFCYTRALKDVFNQEGIYSATDLWPEE